MNTIKVFTDGGARGNPGPAATGVYVVKENDELLFEKGEYIGVTTNNVAEYGAVIAALKWIVENSSTLKISEINFFLDSQLVCSQINGLYKVKNEKLRELLFEVRKLEASIKSPIHYSYIPREQNTNADRMVNRALDDMLQ